MQRKNTRHKRDEGRIRLKQYKITLQALNCCGYVNFANKIESKPNKLPT